MCRLALMDAQELKEELEEIKKANEKGGSSLLTLVYEKYPPRKAEHKLSQVCVLVSNP